MSLEVTSRGILPLLGPKTAPKISLTLPRTENGTQKIPPFQGPHMTPPQGF